MKGDRMKNRYSALAHRAGCIRKKYKLTPYEAVCCTLWLTGAREKDMPELARRMLAIRTAEKGY
ncbi:MAG: hypothetical protein [Chaetfec virus UA24_244]|nr:MAG: hypothetical protein [Chaetfec virus UA24_244]